MPENVPPISAEVRMKFQSTRIARLATMDVMGAPHLVPICFAWDGSQFYSAIDRKPKKVEADRLKRLKNIAQTPSVALLLDEYDEDWTRLWYVLVRGRAELVTAAAERKRALELLRIKYVQYAAGMLDDNAPILRIAPERITSWGKI